MLASTAMTITTTSIDRHFFTMRFCAGVKWLGRRLGKWTWVQVFNWIDVTKATLHFPSAIPISPLYVLGGCLFMIFCASASRYYPLILFTSPARRLRLLSRNMPLALWYTLLCIIFTSSTFLVVFNLFPQLVHTSSSRSASSTSAPHTKILQCRKTT
jgi:hypothetical protein